MAKKSSASNPLLQAKQAIQKVIKENDPTVAIDFTTLKQSLLHVPTGSLVLDYLIGGRPNKYGVSPCPGLPLGKISNIYGHESSGKTTVALHAASHVINVMGGTVAYIDWENALDLSYAQALGVSVQDEEKFALFQPSTLEDGFKVLYACAHYGTNLIILDSVGAGIPEAVVNQPLEDQGDSGRVGLLAAKWSTMLPKIASLIMKSNSHVMGISQLRKKINTMSAGKGDGSTPQGGEGWKFYSSLRMKFQKIESEKTKLYSPLLHKTEEQYTSAKIQAKIEKSKVSDSQQHTANFYIRFGEGIDDIRSAIDICSAHGIIKKGGAWYTWERGGGESIRAQGMVELRRMLAEIPNGEQEIKEMARKKLYDSSTSPAVLTAETNEDELNIEQLLEAEETSEE